MIMAAGSFPLQPFFPGNRSHFVFPSVLISNVNIPMVCRDINSYFKDFLWPFMVLLIGQYIEMTENMMNERGDDTQQKAFVHEMCVLPTELLGRPTDINSTTFFLSLIHCSSDLSEPVDVYSDWIDACEAANQ